jgi:hypothetical protein
MAIKQDFIVQSGLVASTTATIRSTINSVSTTTGALTVAGGAGIGGDLWTQGKGHLKGGLYITDTEYSTSTGALNSIYTDGGAWISKGLLVNGSFELNGSFVGTTATITQITGNSGQFYGDSNGFGALYAGIPLGFSILPSTVLQLTANINDYSQNNFQNLNNDPTASTDWVATSADGTDTINYIDLGITSGTWDGTQANSLGTALGPNDGYLYVQGGTVNQGNLVIGTTNTGTQLKIVVANNQSADIVAEFNPKGTNSTSSITGALTIDGGVGIANDLYVGGTIHGNISGTITTASTVLVNNASTNTTYYVALADNKNADANLDADSALTYDTTNGMLVVPNTSATSISVVNNVQIGGTVTITGGQGYVTILSFNGVSFLSDSVTGFMGGEVITPQSNGLGLNIGTIYYIKAVLSPTRFILSLTPTGSPVGSVGTQTIVGTVGTAPGLQVTANLTSTSTTTGGLVVVGGVGIGGDLNVGGRIIGGGVRTISSSTPPLYPAPTVGDIWYNTSNDAIYRYTADGAGHSYWLDITGPVVYTTV